LSIRSKRSTTRSLAAVIAAALIASLLAIVAGPASAVTPLNKSTATSADGRVSGDDRYGTATAAASSYLTRRGSLTSWNRVVVVSGDNFPDALAAASLAGSYTAPIILMPSDGSLPTVVREWGLTKRDQIQANSTAAATFKFVVVGGTSAVPDAGVQALLDVVNAGDLTPATMTRISGANRAATAKAVATQTNAAGSYTILSAAKEIFVANEASFADAMAIAPYAFNAAAPVLLTGKDSLNADALAVLKTYKTLTGTKVKVLGGPAAISDQVIQDIVNNAGIPLSSIARISGADRYATSVAIQNYVDASSVNNANFDASHVVMVNGQNFADGLAAAPYVGHGTGGAARLMYLTEASGISASVSSKMTTHAKSDFPTNVYAVGGTAAVSADVISGVTTAAQALNTTSTMTCVENSAGTSVTITVPGNITDAQVGSETWLGDEGALILNGALTINGTSNTASASTAMADTYSTTTKNTTLVGLVPAGTLAKGTVITWSGLSELANASVAKRTISGSTCTVADDKVGPSATINAQIGATGFHVTFSEKVTGFDCTDITATIAGFTTGANVGCGAIDQGLTADVYRVASLFDDLNNDGALTAATNALAVASVATADDLMTTGSAHGYSVGDKIVCVTDTADNNGTFFVASVPAATTYGVNATYADALAGTLKNLTDDTDADNTGAGCTRSVEATATLAAGDIIVVDTRAAAAPVAVASVAAISTAGIIGGTVTTSAAHGLAVGDKITLSGLDAAADNDSYEVRTVPSTTTFTVQAPAAFTNQGGAGGTVSKYWLNDLSENAGTAQTTKTMNATNDADTTKPVLSVSLTCTQGAEAVLSNGTTIKATAHATFGPQGVAGNTYKMYVNNSRGLALPTVVVDDTAATITITADLAYTSISDVNQAYVNAGGVAWSFAHQTGSATAMIGTASKTTAATPITSAGGHAGDVVGAQSCVATVTSNEYLQEMAADGTTAVAAINGVATAFSANDGTSDALADGWKKITFDGVLAAWTKPIADGTVTITLNGSNIKDMAGNVVTNLALVD
jgi:putative cell wall-binding protein